MNYKIEAFKIKIFWHYAGMGAEYSNQSCCDSMWLSLGRYVQHVLKLREEIANSQLHTWST